MVRLALPLVALTLLAGGVLTGCGGSGDSDADATRFVFDSAGGPANLTAGGRVEFLELGARVTFAQGNRLLTLNLTSLEPGTYPFGSGASATYGESGVVGVDGWSTGTEGTATVARTGDALRITLSGARFTPDAGNVRAGFVLSGLGIADAAGDPVP